MGLLDLMERAPAPTPAPRAGLVAERLDRLFGRQELDQTCGYIDGDAISPVYCEGSYECVQNTLDNVRGCCLPPITACTLATGCINSADLAADCNGLCSLDNFQIKCSNALSPYCVTRTWITSTPDATQYEYGCTDIIDLQQTAFTTIDEVDVSINANGSLFSTSYSVSAPVALTGGASPTGSSDPGTGASVGSAAKSTAAAKTTGPAATSAAGSNHGVSSSAGSSSGGLSSGATIAIAVCATIVGLALIALAVFLVCWRRRKQDRRAAVAAGPPQSMGYAPPPEHAPFDASPGEPGVVGDYYSPSAVGQAGLGKDDVHWSAVDDDRLASMRRFSNEGTVATIDQTVAGRTNDDFRPQGA